MFAGRIVIPDPGPPELFACVPPETPTALVDQCCAGVVSWQSRFHTHTGAKNLGKVVVSLKRPSRCCNPCDRLQQTPLPQSVCSTATYHVLNRPATSARIASVTVCPGECIVDRVKLLEIQISVSVGAALRHANQVDFLPRRHHCIPTTCPVPLP